MKIRKRLNKALAYLLVLFLGISSWGINLYSGPEANESIARAELLSSQEIVPSGVNDLPLDNGSLTEDPIVAPSNDESKVPDENANVQPGADLESTIDSESDSALEQQSAKIEPMLQELNLLETGIKLDASTLVPSKREVKAVHDLVLTLKSTDAFSVLAGDKLELSSSGMEYLEARVEAEGMKIDHGSGGYVLLEFTSDQIIPITGKIIKITNVKSDNDVVTGVKLTWYKQEQERVEKGSANLPDIVYNEVVIDDLKLVITSPNQATFNSDGDGNLNPSVTITVEAQDPDTNVKVPFNGFIYMSLENCPPMIINDMFMSYSAPMNNGTAIFEINSLKSYVIMVDSFDAELKMSTEFKGNPVSAAIPAKVVPHPKSKSGKVVDDKGQPVAGAIVTVSKQKYSSAYYTAATDAAGKYTFYAPYGETEGYLKVEKGDLYMKTEKTFAYNAGSVSDITLKRLTKFTLNLYRGSATENGVLPSEQEIISNPDNLIDPLKCFFDARKGLDNFYTISEESYNNVIYLNTAEIEDNQNKVLLDGRSNYYHATKEFICDAGREYTVNLFSASNGYIKVTASTQASIPIAGAVYDHSGRLIYGSNFTLNPGQSFEYVPPAGKSDQEAEYTVIALDASFAAYLAGYAPEHNLLGLIPAQYQKSKATIKYGLKKSLVMNPPKITEIFVLNPAKTKLRVAGQHGNMISLVATFETNTYLTAKRIVFDLPSGITMPANYEDMLIWIGNNRLPSIFNHEYDHVNNRLTIYTTTHAEFGQGEQGSALITVQIADNEPKDKLFAVKATLIHQPVGVGDVKESLIGNMQFNQNRELTLYSPNYVTAANGLASASCAVQGTADPDAQVKIYVDGRSPVTLTANKAGTYSGEVILPEVQANKKYKITAHSNNKRVEKLVTFVEILPNINYFSMNGSDIRRIENGINQLPFDYVNISWFPGNSMYFVISTDNDAIIDKMYVNINNNSLGSPPYKVEAKLKDGNWEAKGIVPGGNFVPGMISISYTLDLDEVSSAYAAVTNYASANDRLRDYVPPAEMKTDPQAFWQQMFSSYLAVAPEEMKTATTTLNQDGSRNVSFNWDGQNVRLDNLNLIDITGGERNELISRARDNSLPLGQDGYYYNETNYIVSENGGETKAYNHYELMDKFAEYSSIPDAINQMEIKSMRIESSDVVALPSTNEGSVQDYISTAKSVVDIGSNSLGVLTGLTGTQLPERMQNVMDNTGKVLALYEIQQDVKSIFDAGNLLGSIGKERQRLLELMFSPCYAQMNDQQLQNIDNLNQKVGKDLGDGLKFVHDTANFVNLKTTINRFTMGLSSKMETAASALGLSTNLFDFFVYQETYEDRFKKLKENNDQMRQAIKQVNSQNTDPCDPDDPDGDDDGSWPPDDPMNHPKPRYAYDPSGFAYEGSIDNRIAGVKAELYVADDENGTNAKFWAEAPEWDQINPQITDETGWYQWDTPIGWWQVRLSKEGYQPAQSAWLPVLPIQLGVNLEMKKIGGNNTGSSPGSSGGSSTYTITFNKNEGSASSYATKSIASGKNMLLPDDPQREGYRFMGWNSKADGTGEIITEETVVKSGMVVYAQWQEITVEPEEKPPLANGASKYFDDLATDHVWAIQAVDYLYEKSVITGTGDRMFSPGANLKRGDFMIMLVKAFNLRADTRDNFADVPNDSYYAAAIATAKALGIAKGDGTNFSPESSISRQDALAFIARTLSYIGRELPTDKGNMNMFTDAESIADYAKEDITRLVQAGIITGSEGRINPDSPVTRAEMAIILYKTCN